MCAAEEFHCDEDLEACAESVRSRDSRYVSTRRRREARVWVGEVEGNSRGVMEQLVEMVGGAESLRRLRRPASGVGEGEGDDMGGGGREVSGSKSYAKSSTIMSIILHCFRRYQVIPFYWTGLRMLTSKL